jgi:hypothetical protein
MPKNTLNKTSKLTKASLVQLANERRYKKPVFYRQDKFTTIMDKETGSLALVPIDVTVQDEINSIFNISDQISELPSNTLKESLAYTDNLKEEFNRQRNESIIMGRCFIFVALYIEGDPLIPEKEDKTLDSWTEEIYNQRAYYYRSLFDLIKAGFEIIKKAFPDMSFNKADELFIEIIRDERDSYFERIATTEFIQITTDSLADFWRGIIQRESYEKLEKRCIAQGLGSIHKEVLLHECLDFLEEKAKKNNRIQSRLKAYYTEYNSLAQTIVEACEARNSKGKVKKSIQWRQGLAHTFDNKNRPTIPMRVYKT